MSKTEYKKRSGTSGIQGHLYETKLLSLIFFRLKHDDNVDQFSLATNRDEIGAFDDVCFRAKVKDFNKPLTVFVQAKHRENDKLRTFTIKTDLAKYFDSYLDIRRAFDPSSKDLIFGGKYEEIECFFVMYTTASDDPNNKTYEGNCADYLNELIGTGGRCSQPVYRDDDLDFLCKIVMKEQITTLAEQIAKFICDSPDSEMSMNNDLMLRYHVILELNVLHVSDIKPEGHRTASFRQEFFTTNEEFLVLLRNVLCLEVLKKRKSEEADLQNLLSEFLNEPSDIKTLSKLIGSVLTYKHKHGKLEFVSKSMTDDLKRQLDKANVSETTVYEAAVLATKERLLSLKFKVPALFGNKDLAIRGKPEKIEKRLNHLTTKILEIFEQPRPNNIVTMDESLGDGFLQLNGGIASAVGNILVFDETYKLLKFTDDYESLGTTAKTWYEMLNSKIENLHELRLDVKVKKFPKLSFERGEYDVSLVRDFYDKLLFYTNQADQSGVEEILRGEIEDHPCNDVTNFRIRSDVIFLKYHDEIQKLWMSPVGTYLTKKSKTYENTVTSAMSEPLMSVFNTMHKFKNKDFTFNANAMKLLESHGQVVGTVIATASCALTVAKVEQYLGLEKKDHVVLDLEDVFKLPLKSHNAFCKELTSSNEKVLVILCDNFDNSANACKKLENIAKAVVDKQIIIITKKASLGIITKYFSKVTLLNDKSNLTDLSVECQKKLLVNSKLKFQGEELSLDKILDEESTNLIDEDVLNQMIDNETIVIGKTAVHYNYNKAKPFYIDRRVSRVKNREEDEFDEIKNKVLKTFYDLEDDVVLITASPGMGKSTLLSYLSEKTKEIDPKVWIVRINLLEHARMFSRWQDDKTDIGTLESLKFMCEAALSEESNETYNENDVFIELEESSNGTVTLEKCSGDHSTELQLKMFVHFYNRGKMIFLFDGFDEIFPHYEKEALFLLKSVKSYPRKHKVWITSRSFNHIKHILEEEFGTSYEIEHFTCPEQDIYYNTFWKTKIQLQNLNNEQMYNVHDFLYFMQVNLPNEKFRLFSLLKLNPYFKVYLNFLDFIKLESISHDIDIVYEGYNDFLTKFDINECVSATDDANELTAPPLHLYLLAECFHNKIKDVGEDDKDWDIDVTGYIFYQYYFETKIKNIRFQEKNKIDIYNPDNKMTYEKERAETVEKHKKLGAYAIFYPHEEVFEESVLKEIKDMISELGKAREKTGLIRGVANNIPLFVHRSFAEYFAVEYICDLLKNDNTEVQEKLWSFIINVMFVKCGMNVFDIFNTKVKMDGTLMNVIERNKTKIDEFVYGENCDVKGNRYSWLANNRTDSITLSMFTTLCNNIDSNLLQDKYDFKEFFSTMFNSATQECDSFSLMELNSKLYLGEINTNAKRNQITNYLFLRIRGSVVFYQGLQASRKRCLMKERRNMKPKSVRPTSTKSFSTFSRKLIFELWSSQKPSQRLKYVIQAFLTFYKDDEIVDLEPLVYRIIIVCRSIKQFWVKSACSKDTFLKDYSDWLDEDESVELTRRVEPGPSVGNVDRRRSIAKLIKQAKLRLLRESSGADASTLNDLPSTPGQSNCIEATPPVSWAHYRLTALRRNFSMPCNIYVYLVYGLCTVFLVFCLLYFFFINLLY